MRDKINQHHQSKSKAAKEESRTQATMYAMGRSFNATDSSQIPNTRGQDRGTNDRWSKKPAQNRREKEKDTPKGNTCFTHVLDGQCNCPPIEKTLNVQRDLTKQLYREMALASTEGQMEGIEYLEPKYGQLITANLLEEEADNDSENFIPLRNPIRHWTLTPYRIN